MGKLNDRLMQLEAANNKSQKDNQILREQIFKLTAQAARAKVEKSDRAKLRNHVKRLYMNSFQETAISIFDWQNLPEPKEIKQLLLATEDNEDAFVSRVVPYLKTLSTNAQYFGKELSEEIKNYKNEMFEFLGIAHNQNEKKERQITSEIEVTADQYNMNITKRLKNRTDALEQAKRLWPEDWGGVNIKVNLNGFNEKEEKKDGEFDADAERD